MLYISTCGTRSDIVEFCVIFFRRWNELWYCGILCYIFLHVERTLVLWNFVLHFSACVTWFGIVEFCVVFFCMWNALWYHGISCYIILCVQRVLLLWKYFHGVSASMANTFLKEHHVQPPAPLCGARGASVCAGGMKGAGALRRGSHALCPLAAQGVVHHLCILACCAGGAGAVRRGRHAPCPLAAQGADHVLLKKSQYNKVPALWTLKWRESKAKNKNKMKILGCCECYRISCYIFLHVERVLILC